ncbi:MAG: glycosyltransferase family 2 protein [Paludibacteraceae bacterium]|nr:glycosyltransferase family 2 protein [Paludibacteraceae bacterium]
MLNNKTIAVVAICYNEETQIGKVIETMPFFVDRIVVVNDKSTDKTEKVVLDHIKKDKLKATVISFGAKKIASTMHNKADIFLQELDKEQSKLFFPSKVLNENPEKERIILISHKENGGPGAAYATGYKWCRDYNIDCIAVMDGDGQMDPEELENICMPVVRDEVDFVKGNRLTHRSTPYIMPKVRLFGNSILSLLTKVVSGYWHISDTQYDYKAFNLKTLKKLKLFDAYNNYGCPNDFLVKLNIVNATVREIDSKPVYNVGEKSKMKELKVIPKISWLLFKLFWVRLYKKYLLDSFHPLFLLYHFSFLILLLNIPFSIQVMQSFELGSRLSIPSMLIFSFLAAIGFQSLFFAMWMDMMDNERLHK